MILDFTLLKGDYSIYRLSKDSAVPGWIYDSEFYSITRTRDELSIVCENTDRILDISIKTDKHWRVLKITGPLDLSLIGIIATISGLLKENNISIFTVSTFDTDYILVKNQAIDKTLTVLKNNGFKIQIEK